MISQEGVLYVDDLNTKRPVVNQLPTTPLLSPPPISTSFQASTPLPPLFLLLDLFLFIFDPGLVCSSSPFNPSRCILWVINQLWVFRYFAAAADFPVNVSWRVDHICILQSAVVGVKSSLQSWGRMAARAYWFKCQKLWILHKVGTFLVRCDHSLTVESKSLWRCSALSLKWFSQLCELGSFTPMGMLLLNYYGETVY